MRLVSNVLIVDQQFATVVICLIVRVGWNTQMLVWAWGVWCCWGLGCLRDTVVLLNCSSSRQTLSSKVT